MTQVTKVGFIGLGIMGAPMALNVLRAGYPLTVWNRTREKAKPLLEEGAVWADSPADVARQSDIIITIVSDTPDVEEVILGPNGVIHGARPGSVVIDMSTISPHVTQRIARELAARGIEMLDAPVSGGDIGAQEGTLSIMVGGKPEVFERCLPLLRTMGKRITHVGPNGAGQFTKLVNQIIVVGNTLAMAEGLVFAAKAGLNLEKVLEAVSAGAAGSWMLTHRGPQIIRGDFRPGFTVRLQQKDVRLVLEAAREMAVPLPGTALIHQLYHALEARNLQDEGNHALIKALEWLADVEARQT
ncbi:MAG: 2-hydroxy-3-oxopropionate reductase [Chloroflexi bacterium]|nr:2-hydroxy-3-oxopropionate reductase [Chloroflexota bacterium]